MCAQTRPRFILSSEGVFGGMEFEPMLTPREKSLLPENAPRGGSNPRRCGQRAQALPTELFRPPKCNLNSLKNLIVESNIVAGDRNSSVGSAWARCQSVAGLILLWGHFPVEGIFPLELTWVQTPFPQNSFG